MGNTYARGFPAEAGADLEEQKLAHIWGTEDGPELDLPIIHFPDSTRLTRVRQVGVMRDFITMIPRAYSTMVVKCSARGIIVRKFHIHPQSRRRTPACRVRRRMHEPGLEQNNF